MQRRAKLYWVILCSIAALCCVLAVLQYRWTRELARAEHDRLRNGLQAAVRVLSREFNSELSAITSALQPTSEEIEVQGRETAYSLRWQEWHKRSSRNELFTRVALVVPQDGELQLERLDQTNGTFTFQPWPEEWADLRQNMLSRWADRSRGPRSSHPYLIELPRFGSPGGYRPVEQEWLLLEVNVSYVRTAMFPELLRRHLTPVGIVDFEAEVFVTGQPSELIYRSHPEDHARIGDAAEASVALLELRPPMFNHRRPPPREGRMHEPSPVRRGPPPAEFMMGGEPGPGPGPGDSGRGRWRLVVRSRGGSLDAIVERTRWRNLALSGGILLLLLACVGLLFTFSRRAHKLAELQINFVAGVSHELRTPLTVIRTAAFNLRGKVSQNPTQVERYGSLIQEESQKLQSLVEQVLRFASARSGHIIRERIPVRIERLIEQGIEASRHALDTAGCVVEQHIEPELPPILADDQALKHALQNLLENAAKYGTDGSRWIGVSASKAAAEPDCVEIRVSDRGHGIPKDEQPHIFDAFYRGRRAVQDQIHGTGLGLNLVKQIVQAHGGKVQVESDLHQGTEFILQIPIAQAGKVG